MAQAVVPRGPGSDRARFPVVVHTLIIDTRPDGDYLLLLRRLGTGYGDGLYQPPGGYLQVGESVVAAAARECREESGLRIEPSDLHAIAAMPYGPLVGSAPGIEGIDLLFVLAWQRSQHGDPVIGEPHKCDHMAWFACAAPPANAVPFLTAALSARATGRWYREFP